LTSTPYANTQNKNGASIFVNHFEVIQNHEEFGQEDPKLNPKWGVKK